MSDTKEMNKLYEAIAKKALAESSSKIQRANVVFQNALNDLGGIRQVTININGTDIQLNVGDTLSAIKNAVLKESKEEIINKAVKETMTNFRGLTDLINRSDDEPF